MVRHGEPVRRVDLSQLVLDGADLSGGTSEEVRFSRTMRGVLLKEANLVECDLSECDASGADLHLAKAYRCRHQSHAGGEEGRGGAWLQARPSCGEESISWASSMPEPGGQPRSPGA